MSRSISMATSSRTGGAERYGWLVQRHLGASTLYDSVDKESTSVLGMGCKVQWTTARKLGWAAGDRVKGSSQEGKNVEAMWKLVEGGIVGATCCSG